MNLIGSIFSTIASYLHSPSLSNASFFHQQIPTSSSSPSQITRYKSTTLKLVNSRSGVKTFCSLHLHLHQLPRALRVSTIQYLAFVFLLLHWLFLILWILGRMVRKRRAMLRNHVTHCYGVLIGCLSFHCRYPQLAVTRRRVKSDDVRRAFSKRNLMHKFRTRRV